MSHSALSPKGLFLVLVAVLFWSGNFVIVRASVGAVPPMAIGFYRWLLASVFTVALAWPQLRRDLPLLLRNWRILLLLGCMGIGCNSIFMFYGLQTTSAINALLLNSMSPLLTAFLGFVFFTERPSARSMLGLGFAILGVTYVVIGGDWHALMTLRLNAGDFWVLLGVGSYTVYMVFLRKVPPMRDLSMNAATFTLGTLVMLPLFLMERAGGAVTDWSQPISWISIIYMALASSVVAYFCFNKAIRLIGATRASSFLLLTPLIGSMLAMLFLGEQLTWAHIIGGALIFTGLFIGRR